MIQCQECKKIIIEDIKFNHWLALVNYFEHEFDEDEITVKTYENMMNRLMTLKPDFED